MDIAVKLGKIIATGAFATMGGTAAVIGGVQTMRDYDPPAHTVENPSMLQSADRHLTYLREAITNLGETTDKDKADARLRHNLALLMGGGAATLAGSGGLIYTMRELTGDRRKRRDPRLQPVVFATTSNDTPLSEPLSPKNRAPQQQRWTAGNATGSLEADRVRAAQSQQQQQ